MPTDRFVIAPLDTGLQNDVKPFLIPDDAFSELNNAYVFRGRVTKRFGSRLMNMAVDDDVAQLYSRLGIAIGVTNGAGIFGPVVVPGITWKIGQMFAIGDQIYTVFQPNGPMLSTAVGPIASFDTATGIVQFAGATPGTIVYFYPSEPVMGITNYQRAAINNEETIAFDTQFSYHYVAGRWESLEAPPVKIWTGTDSQFFWSTNFRGLQASDYTLFTTNFNPPDFMAYWTGGPNWTNFRPAYNVAGDTVDTARLIIPFKGRLLLLNTFETITATGVQSAFSQRCRFSQVGSPLNADAFFQLPETAGRGGYLDASTREAIISCRILKDRLIVFFEQSTWELVFTNNQANPFLWQKINAELGIESTFSTVLFDKVVMGVGNVGIVACNGANVDRIDQKIPYDVFQIRNSNDGTERVQGIRDYYNEMVYWTFPIEDVNDVYPSKILAFNYKNGSWAFFDDSVTCWGYYQDQIDRTWGNMSIRWQDATETWDGATYQAQFRNIVAGNQQGFVFIVDDNLTINAQALQITDINQAAPGSFFNVVFHIVDHNLTEDDFVYIDNISGTNDFLQFNGFVWKVYQRIDSSTIIIQLPGGSVLSNYNGGGTIRQVSRVDILTKMYNFYPQAARNMLISKVDFNVDTTQNGAVTVDYFTSSSVQGLTAGAAATGALIGDGTLDMTPYALVPQEATRDYLIHPVYIQADGEWVQLRIYYSDAQMLANLVSSSDFELNAMIFYATQTSSRLQ